MRRAAALPSAAVSLALAAVAAAGETGSAARWELTPLAGYTLGGEIDDETTDEALEFDDAGHLGLILNLRADYDTQWEVFYTRRSTELDAGGLLQNEPVLDLDVHYLHAGGTAMFDAPLGRSFVAASLGVTRLDPDPGGLEADSFFSFSLGGGLKLWPERPVGLRLEARVLGTVLGGDEDILCRTSPDDNFCFLRVDGDILWQWQLSVGTVFRF